MDKNQSPADRMTGEAKAEASKVNEKLQIIRKFMADTAKGVEKTEDGWWTMYTMADAGLDDCLCYLNGAFGPFDEGMTTERGVQHD